MLSAKHWPTISSLQRMDNEPTRTAVHRIVCRQDAKYCFCHQSMLSPVVTSGLHIWELGRKGEIGGAWSQVVLSQYYVLGDWFQQRQSWSCSHMVFLAILFLARHLRQFLSPNTLPVFSQYDAKEPELSITDSKRLCQCLWGVSACVLDHSFTSSLVSQWHSQNYSPVSSHISHAHYQLRTSTQLLACWQWQITKYE